MIQIDNTITAEKGKLLRRIADSTIYGKTITLGYTYYIGGKLLTTPHKDVPSDFEEIEDPDYVITLEDIEGNIEPLTELNKAKANKRLDIYKYDKSSNVNEFFYSGNSFWLDKDTRVGLVNSTNMEKQLGRETTTLILGDTIVTFPCDTVLQMLALLEVYAKDCYNVTANHIITVNNLTTIEDVNNYNYQTGYPDKLTFGV